MLPVSRTATVLYLDLLFHLTDTTSLPIAVEVFTYQSLAARQQNASTHTHMFSTHMHMHTCIPNLSAATVTKSGDSAGAQKDILPRGALLLPKGTPRK